jgi:hypothetical protein
MSDKIDNVTVVAWTPTIGNLIVDERHGHGVILDMDLLPEEDRLIVVAKCKFYDSEVRNNFTDTVNINRLSPVIIKASVPQ